MLRIFHAEQNSNKRILNIGQGTRTEIPIFHLNSGSVVYDPSRHLSTNTGWLVTAWAIDDSNGCKYVQVGNDVWVRFVASDILDKPSTNTEYKMSVSEVLDNNFNVAVDNTGNRYSIDKHGWQSHRVTVFHDADTFQELWGPYADWSAFKSDKAIEIAQNQRRWFGFEVSANAYFYYDDVRVDSPTLNYGNSTYEANTFPIDKTVIVTSTIPDIFDKYGNASSFKIDCGVKFKSKAIIVTPEFVGFKIKDNVFISVDSASATSINNGAFKPVEQGA